MDLYKIMVKFIWQGEKARVKMKLLQDKKEHAGLELPNWEAYYNAAALNWIKECLIRERFNQAEREVKLEADGLQIGWHAFLIYDKAKYYRLLKQHLIRKALMKVWEQLRYIQ